MTQFSKSVETSKTYRMAIDGEDTRKGVRDRSSSIKIYEQYILDFENNGSISDETKSYVYHVLKKIIEVDSKSAILGSNTPAELQKALGLTGVRASETEQKARFIRTVASIVPPGVNETSEQRNIRITKYLKMANYYPDKEKYEISKIICDAINFK
jgi:hypothetical protein